MNESAECRKTIVESMLRDPSTVIQNLEKTSDVRDTTAGQVVSLACRINQAPIVYWRHDLLQAALSGWETWMEHPPEAFPLLNRQVWIFGKPWKMRCGAVLDETGPETPRSTIPLLSMAYLDRDWLPDAWILFYVYHVPPEESDHCTLNCFLGVIPAGVKCAGDGAAEVMAAMAFMKLKVAAVERQALPRAVRREHQRTGASLPDIRIVTLRRTYARDPGRKEDVNWSCQWIVGGHWRNQWYESRLEHEPVYILPYVKGPRDKPLRVPKQVLYRVEK